MAILQVNDIYMGFSGETLFKDINFSVDEKDISLKRVSPEKPIYISFTCNIAKIPPQTIIFSLFFYQNKQL